MQQLKIFSIRDTKGENYFPPFYQRTEGEAERSFTQLVRDQKSTISQHPEDFDLFHLGTFDDSTGKIQPLETPRHMVKAIDLVNRN